MRQVGVGRPPAQLHAVNRVHVCEKKYSSEIINSQSVQILPPRMLPPRLIRGRQGRSVLLVLDLAQGLRRRLRDRRAGDGGRPQKNELTSILN